MQTKKLHELIQLAKARKKFKAVHPSTEAIWMNVDFLDVKFFESETIISDWEYQEIREPEVVETILEIDSTGFWTWLDDQWQKLKGKKWKVVFTEVVDE